MRGAPQHDREPVRPTAGLPFGLSGPTTAASDRPDPPVAPGDATTAAAQLTGLAAGDGRAHPHRRTDRCRNRQRSRGAQPRRPHADRTDQRPFRRRLRVERHEIRDSIVSLIAAGYETTSAALAWATYTLLTLPGAWETAAREVARVLGGTAPSAETLGALTYLNGVVHETLRLYSPGVVSARRLIRDLWFDGHRINSGRLLIFSAYVTHRIPEVWPNPTQFLPQRWDPAAPDYRKPAPHEFIPFSGGLHRCIGAVMATTELVVLLARLVARTRLRLPAQRIRAANFAALAPKPGLRVEFVDSVPAQ